MRDFLETRTVPSGTWRWPVELEKYNRAEPLTLAERTELGIVLNRFQENKYPRIPASSCLSIIRLVEPIEDVLHWYKATDEVYLKVVYFLGQEMYLNNASFWQWSSEDWCRVIKQKRKKYGKRGAWYKNYLFAVGYLLCGFSDLSAIDGFKIKRFAEQLFGSEIIQSSAELLAQQLELWGYENVDTIKNLTSILSRLSISNYSPYIEDLTYEVMLDAYVHSLPQVYRNLALVVSHVLAQMDIIERPLESSTKRRQPLALTVDKVDGLSQEWLSWCKRWHSTAVNRSRKYRDSTFGILLRIGRWLYQQHPQVTNPEQWTRDIALDWVRTTEHLRGGEYAEKQNTHPKKLGRPLSYITKMRIVTAARIFFLDCQEWEWIKRRFDPLRSLATPKHWLDAIGPKPRKIKDDVWAKLLWAGLNLSEGDLPSVGKKTATNRHLYYPIEMVRAIAFVWLFCGLRQNEIYRLRKGCISHQEESAPIPNTNDYLPPRSVSYLQVPVSKTYHERTIPVDRIVGEAIEEWEKIRPEQMPHLDKKTGESVNILFMYRNKTLGGDYINLTLIPILCKKAGIPREDARGRITSHRARSTIASQLFNSKDPMSLFEIQQWLGHKRPETTQHYVATTPTKLAQSFMNAEYFKRNIRTIEVLIDQTVIKNGLASNGEPWKYYDLGHGYCTYDFFDQCPHRMACAKCSFYLPKNSSRAQLLEAKENLQRMLQEIPLAEEERAAVEDGIEAMERLQSKLHTVPAPDGSTPQRRNIIPISLIGVK